MQKTYNRINWENYPSDRTPLNETNLNKLDVGVNELDNRIITLDNTKFDKTEASQLIKNFELDKATGIITVTYLSGATATIDTMLEKLAINFDFDKTSQKLVIVLDDGTVKEIDLTALITEYEFKSTDTVAFSVDADGNVSAIVKDGSIQERHLRPNYLSDIMMESAKAEASAVASDASAIASESSAVRAESWTVGGTGTRTGEDTDNAKFYYEASKQIFNDFENVGAVVGVKGDAETDYRAGLVNITAENIGLGNVDNTADKDKNVKYAEGAGSANSAINDSENRNIAEALNRFADVNGKTKEYTGDLNNINYNSIFNVSGGTNKNTPVTNTWEWGFVVTTVHCNDDSYVSQLWLGMTSQVIYYRNKIEGSWEDWKKIEAGTAETAKNVSAEAGNANTSRHVWFSDGSTETKRNYDDDFSYNPNTNTLNVTNINGRNISDVLNRVNGTTWGAAELYSGDLDDIVVQSIYNVNGTTDLHSPVNGWGFVITLVHNYNATTHKAQLWVGMTNNKVYYRYKSGSWIGWVEMTQNTQILNTATAIEASTSDDNIVGAKGLKEYVERNSYKLSAKNATAGHIKIPTLDYIVYFSVLVFIPSTGELARIKCYGGDGNTWIGEKEAILKTSGGTNIYMPTLPFSTEVEISITADAIYAIECAF